MNGYNKSGIDVVLCQLMPGVDEVEDCKSLLFNSERNNIFYHYELAKLGSSAARLVGKESALCEIFGAYGWQEGLKLEKWLVDHMLVRGINFFVPHAFTISDFPDSDCPPHFYAFGNNPHYPYFKRLMQYTSRLSELFSGGSADIQVAVLYPAEQEWANAQLNSNVRTEMALTRNQIDFDIVPIDSIHKKSYAALLVPESEYMPKAVKEEIGKLSGGGMTVRVVNEQNRDDIVSGLAKKFRTDITDTQHNYLRTMKYCHDGMDVYMLFNEHPGITIELTLNLVDTLCEYDALNNVFFEVPDKNVTLKPYESRVYISKQAIGDTEIIKKEFTVETQYSGDTFMLDKMPEKIEIDFGIVHETAVVRVNGQDAGVCISAPYRLLIDKEFLKTGENKLEVEVVSTLNHKQFDALSLNCAEEPVGWDGKFKIRY
jgi:hypothetical protein